MHRLPVSDLARAAALATIGHAIEPPRAYAGSGSTGKDHVTFFITGGVQEAGQIVEAHALGKLAGDHPYAVCLAGIEAGETLRAWLRQPHLTPRAVRVPGSKTLRFLTNPPAAAETPSPPVPVCVMSVDGSVSESGTLALLPPDVLAAHDRTHAVRALDGVPYPLLPHHFAAAAIVCGCVPLELTAVSLNPALRLSVLSATLEHVSLVGLSLAAQGRASGPLPGFAPGEHPFEYALEAIRHFHGFRATAELAARNRIHCITPRHGGPKSAVFSEGSHKSNALLERWDPASKRLIKATLRDHIRTHIA